MARHLKYGGSTIGRVMKCRASAALSQTVPSAPPSEYAREGTTAHELLERAVKERLSDVLFLVGADEDITLDMARAVNTVLEYLLDRTCGGLAAHTVRSECFVQFPYSIEAGGTADIQIELPETDEREIIDFKYGFDPVEADAPQLLFYAVCAFGFESDVRCTVVQPRAFHREGEVRSVLVPKERLLSFFLEAVAAMEEAEAPYAPYTPDTEACSRCPAASVCPALEAAALSLPAARNLRELARTGCVLPQPADLDAPRLSTVMHMAPLLKAWLSAVEDQAYLRAMNGSVVPGFKLVGSTKHRSWPEDRTPEQIAIELAKVSGAEPSAFISKTLLPITKAQTLIATSLIDTGLKKRDANKLAKEVIALIVERKTSDSLTLVPESDPRAPVNKAARDFAGITFNGEHVNA